MGNESSTLQQCNILNAFETKSSKVWSHHPAIREDDSKVSVFILIKNNKEELSYFENAIKHLKILRHPGILKYYSCYSLGDSIYLVTEPVQPLELILDNLTTSEICAGIHNILEAIHFLHSKCNLCHNDISLGAIYVAQDGVWKLGNMDHVCKFSEATPTNLNNCREMRDEKSISPEEKEGKIVMCEEYGHSRDAYSFGILLQHFLEYLRDLGEIIEDFEQRIELECLNPDPTQRSKLNSLLNDKIFKNDFLEILHFLHNIPVKTEEEKIEFFKTLAFRLFNLPSKLVASRLGHLLLSRFVLLEPTALEKFLPHFLTPRYDNKTPEEFNDDQVNPLVPSELFIQYIIPELLHIFSIPESHLRLVLLKYFAAFAPLVSKPVLQNQILPQLLLGLKDTCDALVASSLRSLADLVPLLGGSVVIGVERAKYFGEGKPKFQRLLPTTLSNETLDTNLIILPSTNDLVNKNTGSQDTVIKSQDTSDIVLKKQQEKELRREEMKKKREERRKKREEEHQMLAKIEEKSIDRMSLEETTSFITEDPIIELLERSAPDGGEAVPEKTSTLVEDPSQRTEDEWSDWEGIQGDSDGMADKPSFLPISEHLQLPSILPEAYHSQAAVNHSLIVNKDMNELQISRKSDGAMKLIGSTKINTKENILLNQPSHEDYQELSSNPNAGRNLTEKPLGQEFDVLAIEIKPTNLPIVEFDYFADMEPVINKTSNSFVSDLESPTLKSVDKNKMAYHISEEDSAGWDVDE